MRNDGGVAASLDLYLASKSPRRHQLLTQAGIRFAVCEPGAEYVAGQSEHASEAGDPVALAIDRARRKARGAQLGDAAVPILAVDTVVDLARVLSLSISATVLLKAPSFPEVVEHAA